MNYHLREVICIETIVKPPLPTVSMLTGKEIAKAERVWNDTEVMKRSRGGLAKLYRLTKIQMVYLCGLCGIVIDDPKGKVSKKAINAALLVSGFPGERGLHETVCRLDAQAKGRLHPKTSEQTCPTKDTVQKLVQSPILHRDLKR